jgi:putative acetyltransferase
MHIEIIKTDASNSDFVTLTNELDADLKVRDGEEHSFFAQFNKIADIKYVLVAYGGDVAIGCGAIKHYSEGVMEIKRMFVLPSTRGKGIASQILSQLELWAAQLQYEKCILETGVKQFEALALYSRRGYSIIPNYGQYKDVASSVCYEKLLK